MKRRWLIGAALVLLAVLIGGMLRQQGVFPLTQSTGSIKPADEPVIRAGSAGPDGNMSAVSLKPADEHVMQYLQTLLETWKRNAQEPTQQKP